jgi:protoporphyrinogen/coproporphyrinogen III oxidase
MTVVVVGAGITGLTTAHTVLRHNPGADVVVVDSDDPLGGKIRTTEFAGHLVDCGADAFLARVPEGLELCRELGLDHRLVSPAARRAYVYVDGALRGFPDRLVLGIPTDLEALAASGVVSASGVARAAEDLTMPGDVWRGDESVGSLVRRRVGDEVFERLVAPLLSGVNAGNADQLSVEAGAPQFAAALREQPSLIAGLRRQREAANDPEAPVFFGFPTGTQTLTDALDRRIRAAGGAIRSSTKVSSIERRTAGYRVRLAADGEAIDADAIALTTPAPASARLLQPLQPEVATGLGEVEYSSVVMVAFAFPRAATERALDGSGFLVAEGEGLLLTACSWASSKWAHLDDGEHIILRVSAGRHHDRRALDLDDDDLVAALVADLGRTMDITGPPGAVRVTRWPESLPQFPPGHLDRVRAWRAALASELPGLVMGGAAFDGLGLPACIRQGRRLAAEAVGALTA